MPKPTKDIENLTIIFLLVLLQITLESPKIVELNINFCLLFKTIKLLAAASLPVGLNQRNSLKTSRDL